MVQDRDVVGTYRKWYMACWIGPFMIIPSNLQGHSPTASFFKCDFSFRCATVSSEGASRGPSASWTSCLGCVAALMASMEGELEVVCALSNGDILFKSAVSVDIVDWILVLNRERHLLRGFLLLLQLLSLFIRLFLRSYPSHVRLWPLTVH